jgi:hypothetical protein
MNMFKLMKMYDNSLEYSDLRLLPYTSGEIYYYFNTKNKNIYKYEAGRLFTICNEYYLSKQRSRL